MRKKSVRDTIYDAIKNEKEYFKKVVKKYNIYLETFDFREPDFVEKFNAYKDDLTNKLYKDMPRNKDGSRPCNTYCDQLIDYYTMEQHQYPTFLKKFLSKFVQTKFFAKSYNDYKESYPDYEDYCYANWYTSGSRANTVFDNINNIFNSWVEFGDIPRYQYDSLKAIHIDFVNREAHIVTGWAVAPYASRIIKNERKLQRYMVPLVEKLFKDYDKWKKDTSV